MGGGQSTRFHVMKLWMIPALGLLLTGCTIMQQVEPAPPEDPAASGAAPVPPSTARTVEDFDTTTAADRAAAANPKGGGRRLGTTIASLGDPARPGFWIMTGLVEAETAGRIEFPAKGTSAEVTLIPSGGGSARVSLAALRLLEVPLADLPELVVFAN